MTNQTITSQQVNIVITITINSSSHTILYQK